MLRPKALDHVGLKVTDMEKSFSMEAASVEQLIGDLRHAFMVLA